MTQFWLISNALLTIKSSPNVKRTSDALIQWKDTKSDFVEVSWFRFSVRSFESGNLPLIQGGQRALRVGDRFSAVEQEWGYPFYTESKIQKLSKWPWIALKKRTVKRVLVINCCPLIGQFFGL